MPQAGYEAQTADAQIPKQLLYHGFMLGKRRLPNKNFRASLKYYLE